MNERMVAIDQELAYIKHPEEEVLYTTLT